MSYFYTLWWNKGDSYKKRRIDFEKRCENIFETLKLNHCKDTVIGSLNKNGLSGGERRRILIAVELI